MTTLLYVRKSFSDSICPNRGLTSCLLLSSIIHLITTHTDSFRSSLPLTTCPYSPYVGVPYYTIEQWNKSIAAVIHRHIIMTVNVHYVSCRMSVEYDHKQQQVGSSLSNLLHDPERHPICAPSYHILCIWNDAVPHLCHNHS